VAKDKIKDIKDGIFSFVKKFDNQIIAKENNKAITNGISKLAHIIKI
jgi:hypothetical protein